MIVIIGAGPAGLFAADALAGSGEEVTVLDMGKKMQDRKCPKSRACDCKRCDILEGVGGAGGFSDGKNTYSISRGTQLEDLFKPSDEDLLMEIDRKMILHSICGKWSDQVNAPSKFANAGFKLDTYPLRHVGSEGIREFIINFADDIVRRGVELKHGCEVEAITYSDNLKKYILLVGEEGVHYQIDADKVIIASGLQGSPWMEAVADGMRIPLSHGPAGFGIRFEAPYAALEELFDLFYDFKLSKEYNGMIYRSFCCNRRGWVVNENHRTMQIRNVNGHSFFEDPKSEMSNFAIIAKIPGEMEASPQAFVRSIARCVNHQGNDGTVVQRASDFMKGVSSAGDLDWRTNKQARTMIDLNMCIPEDLADGFKKFIKDLDAAVPGVLNEKSLIYAPEIKYYGMKFPIDFNTWEVKPGLYVIGNASGYLDSFVSASMTGIISARHILANQKKI